MAKVGAQPGSGEKAYTSRETFRGWETEASGHVTQCGAHYEYHRIYFPIAGHLSHLDIFPLLDIFNLSQGTMTLRLLGYVPPDMHRASPVIYEGRRGIV